MHQFRSNIILYHISIFTITCALAAHSYNAHASAEFFDDFNYLNSSDPAISSFGWTIVDGTNSPPANSHYDPENIAFYVDNGNSIMTLSTIVAGTFASMSNARN